MQTLTSTHLYQEIHEQPRVIQQLIEHPQAEIQQLAGQIGDRGIRRVLLAARGTSDNAGRYAKYLFGAHNQLDVSLATPSLFTVYNEPPDLRDSLVIGISQSGKSPDIVSVLTEGQRQGALTAAITNIPDSDLGRAADFVFALQAGDEISLAATKTYTAQLTVIALISSILSDNQQWQEDLAQLPAQMHTVFDVEAEITQLAERYRYMQHCVTISRGFNYASAFEFSLKLKELTYTIAEPYSSADFLHGPVALVDSGFPVFIFAPSGKMVPEMLSLASKVRRQQAEVVLISDQQDVLSESQYHFKLPTGIPEWLSPISAIIPCQVFAMALAHTRGIEVDQPRGLSKVTETW